MIRSVMLDESAHCIEQKLLMHMSLSKQAIFAARLNKFIRSWTIDIAASLDRPLGYEINYHGMVDMVSKGAPWTTCSEEYI